MVEYTASKAFDSRALVPFVSLVRINPPRSRRVGNFKLEEENRPEEDPEGSNHLYVSSLKISTKAGGRLLKAN